MTSELTSDAMRCRHCGQPIRQDDREPAVWWDCLGYARTDDHDHAPPAAATSSPLVATEDALAASLVATWRACDENPGSGNLAESLSVALAKAATQLGLAVNPGLDASELLVLREAAGELLVRHRPGCWEAEHVRALVYPPDLLD
jgi:hypothetical protein